MFSIITEIKNLKRPNFFLVPYQKYIYNTFQLCSHQTNGTANRAQKQPERSSDEQQNRDENPIALSHPYHHPHCIRLSERIQLQVAVNMLYYFQWGLHAEDFEKRGCA